MTDRMGGSLVVLFTVFWIAAVAFLVGRVGTEDPPGAGPATTPTAQPSPMETALPVEIEFGDALDPETNEVIDARQNFPPGSTLAFAAPVAAMSGEEVFIEVAYLHWNGGYDVRLEGEPLPLDQEDRIISGSFPTDELIEQLGRGSFRLRILGESDEVLALGVFQLDATAPEELTIFAEPLPVVIAAGEHVGYQFNGAGEVTAEHRATVEEESEATSLWRATYDGQPYLLLTDGDFAGFWIPDDESVTLRDS